jgi:hypothetical protein
MSLTSWDCNAKPIVDRIAPASTPLVIPAKEDVKESDFSDFVEPD